MVTDAELTITGLMFVKGTVQRKRETRRHVLQTDFNELGVHTNDIDHEWSVPNEAYARAVM